MRLSRFEIEAIREAASTAFGPGTRVTLFGSRVDDRKRGGDIDLLISPAHSDGVLARKLGFLAALERRLGERKVDVVVAGPEDGRPIVEVARRTGVPL